MSGNNDLDAISSEKAGGPANKSPPKSIQKQHSFFSVPEPIKRVFDRFPLYTYPSNHLPRRSPTTRNSNRLYIFSTSEDALSGRPSFNPTCLKWQAYLKFSKIEHTVIASTNHASPTGSLPFLLPSAVSNQPPPSPIPSNKLQTWILEQQHQPATSENRKGKQPQHARSEVPEAQEDDMRHAAYSSLIDYRIYHAWLYTVYLDPSNRASVALPLYINSSTSNPLVRATLAHQLHRAARDELLKWSNTISEDDLYLEASRAFEALQTLLSIHEYFFDSPRPGLFDASVFAYTHLLLDDDHVMRWKNMRLKEDLLRYEGLLRHRDRCLELFNASSF